MRFVHALLAATLCTSLASLAGGCSDRTREKTKDAAESAGQDIERRHRQGGREDKGSRPQG